MKCQYFLGAVRVTRDIADELAIRLRRGIETKGNLNRFILEITIDGLGATDNEMPRMVLRKYSASTAALVLESSPPMITSALIPCLMADLGAYRELFFAFQLGTAASDNIEPSGVSEFR